MKQVPTKISPPLSIGQRIIAFNKGLQYTGSLPEGFAVLNPYLDNPETLEVMTAFYNRFYHDEHILVDNEEEKVEKLALVYASKVTIANCLAILGIKAPDKM